MRSIITSLLLLAAAVAGAQINPTSQINWPAATGSGAPGGTCAGPEYGLPYTDTTANVQYVCSTSGWVQVSGSGGPPSGSAGGDLGGSYPNPTVAKVNGGAVPASQSCVGTNSSSQIVSGICGGGVIASNSYFVFIGTSMNDDDNNILSATVTLTAWSTSGGTTTVTNSGTNGFYAGQWISMRYATGWPAVPSTMQSFGTGATLFQVLSTGLSSTQFEITTGSIGAGTCSSSCGSAYSAMSYLPFATTSSIGMPSGASAATYSFCANGCTIAGIATNYTALLHPISPAVTGKPGYLILNGPNNDIGICTSAASIESSYQTVFTDAHPDGWIIVAGTPTAINYQTTGCAGMYNNQLAVDQWLRLNGKSTVLAASPSSTAYWDILTDVGAVLNNGADTTMIATNGGLGTKGAKAASSNIAADLMSGGGRQLPSGPAHYGLGSQTAFASVNGWIYSPAVDGAYAFQWWNAARTNRLMSLDTTSGGLTLPQSTAYVLIGNAGGCPSWGGPFCAGGSAIDGSGNLFMAGYIRVGISQGIGATSGGSSLTCWNTNYGATACGSSGGLNGTVTYTSSQSASSSDNGKLVVMNCSGACAYTLPTSQPSTTWNAWVMSIGSTTATIALGGGDTFNGSTSVPVLNRFRVLSVWANTATSTDYEGDAPLVAGSNVTFTPASNGLSVAAPTAGGTYYQTVQANGSSQTQEPKLNLKSGTNATVSCADNPGASSTDCTVSATGGGSGAWTNITGTVTASGCTVSSGVCTANSSTGTVTFSSIPGTYTHLKIIVDGSGSGQAGRCSFKFQFNGDTGSDYYDNYGEINGGSYTTGGADTGVTSMLVGEVGGTAVPIGGGEVTVLNYANTGVQKVVLSPMTYAPSSTSSLTTWQFDGHWNQTSAITSVAIIMGNGSPANWATTSTFSIWGVN